MRRSFHFIKNEYKGYENKDSMIRSYYKSKNIKTINLQFSSYIKEYAKRIAKWDGDETDKPRELLQEIGVKILREKIDPLFLVKRMINDIKVYSNYFDVITISDARAIDELEMIKKEFENVTTIRLTRPNFDNGLTEKEKNDFTETNLDNYHNFDYEIVNDGTIEDLKEKFNELMKVIK